MDIKCCGVHDENEEAWAEAVLFYRGSEVAVSEVEDELLGEWMFEYNGETYIAVVKMEEAENE